MREDPKPPTSPDRLDEGLRGRITGVTRIGPRAFLAAFLVVFSLLLAILYGVTRSGGSQQGTAIAAVPVASDVPTSDAHFGANEPVYPSSDPATPPPPLVLPPTSAPDVQNTASTSGGGGGAPSGPSAADLAAERAEAARESAVAAEQEREREALEAARKSPILTGTQGGGQASGSPVQLAYAPSSSGDGSARMTGFAGNGGGAQYADANGSACCASHDQQPAAPAPAATGYLNGPFGQYQVNGPGVTIPRGARSEDYLQSTRFGAASPFELVASSVIPAELISAIDTDQPGLITGLVREDVFDSKTGKYLLIPKGSRLIGVYNSGLQYGQDRLLVAWRRLIFPDTSSVDLLNMTGTDVNGGAGLAGNVDNHDGRLFSAALLTSILSTGAALAGGNQSFNPYGTVTAGQALSQQVAGQVANVGTTIVNRNLGVPPTLHIPKGYPFLVLVDRDIVFPGPYRPQ